MSEEKYKSLILSSRGVTHQQRHLVSELLRLLPGSQKEVKIDRIKHPGIIQELAEKNACNQVLYLETKGKVSVLWAGKYPDGPSIKFLLQNIRTSEELKMPGNCSIRNRHAISFDSSFSKDNLLKVVKETLTQLFSVPKNAEKVQGSVDRIFGFANIDSKIFFRNFEVVSENEIVEIGPRFVLTVVKVMSGFMQNEVLYTNGKYLGNKKKTKKPKPKFEALDN